MPWKEVTLMSARKEFVLLARQENTNVRALCRRFGISPKTGYKLLKRYADEGETGLRNRSRQPKSSPHRTAEAMETAVLALRDQHPAWGSRKLRKRLQTQGKDERFHRTLKAEWLAHEIFADQADAQRRLDAWRNQYNLERPHQALGLETPIRHYRPSQRPFPETLSAIEYGPDDIVRKVQSQGELNYRGRIWKVGQAFHGYPVALRPTAQDGCLDVYFCQHCIASINLLITYWFHVNFRANSFFPRDADGNG